MKSALLLIAATALSASAADKLVGGPYVLNTGGRSATIAWVVQGGEVSLGTSPGDAARSAPALRAEKVSFSGIQPGKTYYYDLKLGDAGKGSFRAPPAPGDPFRFLVYGDTRTRHDVHRTVVSAMLKEPTPDFALHTGDLVADGSDSSLWPTFFDIERELLRKTSFFPSLGNHERNDQQFYDFFDMKLPYYSFNWGNAHFVVLDSDIGNVAPSAAARNAFWAAEEQWLEDDLSKNQEVAFRFVAAHHPPMTAVSNRQGSNPHMIALTPVFERFHVNAAFFGHDHNYQHYLKNDIHYVVTGGGGAPLYDVLKPPEGITQKVISVENFVTVSIEGKTAKVEAKGTDGKILDAFEITSKQ